MLGNEKYIGEVKLLKLGNGEVYYLTSGNNQALISKEVLKQCRLRRIRGVV